MNQGLVIPILIAVGIAAIGALAYWAYCAIRDNLRHTDDEERQKGPRR